MTDKIVSIQVSNSPVRTIAVWRGAPDVAEQLSEALRKSWELERTKPAPVNADWTAGPASADDVQAWLKENDADADAYDRADILVPLTVFVRDADGFDPDYVEDVSVRIEALRRTRHELPREDEELARRAVRWAVRWVAHSANEKRRQRPPKPPNWERLILRQGNDGDIAEFDGKIYSLPQNGLTFLSTLREAKGLPVSSTSFGSHVRPDRVLPQLFQRLKRIIIRPNKKGARNGYRMRP